MADGWGAPELSPEQLLRFMDEERIALSVLSLTAPGVEGWAGDARIEMTCRVANYGARLMKDEPSRFGYFATLPLPDVVATLTEIKSCYDELHFSGFTLHRNRDDICLSDPRFDTVWEELNQRSATISFSRHVHPCRCFRARRVPWPTTLRTQHVLRSIL